jgi:hypothetical protein
VFRQKYLDIGELLMTRPELTPLFNRTIDTAPPGLFCNGNRTLRKIFRKPRHVPLCESGISGFAVT